MARACTRNKDQGSPTRTESLSSTSVRARTRPILQKRCLVLFNASEHTRLLADVFGIPAAFLHGLFGYSYGSDALVLQPTLPRGVSSLEQLFPVRFGNVTLYLSMSGASRLSTPNPPLRHFSLLLQVRRRPRRRRSRRQRRRRSRRSHGRATCSDAPAKAWRTTVRTALF